MSHKVSLNPSKKKNSYVNRKPSVSNSPSKRGENSYSVAGVPFTEGGMLPDVLPSAPFPHMKGKP